MENLKIETINIKAFVIEDKKEGVFTVSLESKGGPIISAKTHDEACRKFEEALHLSCAVQNLNTFYDSVKNAEKADTVKKVKRKEPKIEFIEMQMA